MKLENIKEGMTIEFRTQNGDVVEAKITAIVPEEERIDLSEENGTAHVDMFARVEETFLSEITIPEE